jgi:hypothetical protein
VGHHIVFFLAAGGILLAAFLFQLDSIPFRTCLFSRWTGFPCISCGYTRAFVAMADGNWAYVLQDCPVVILLYAVTAMVFAWNTAALILGVTIKLGSWTSRRIARWSALFVLVVLALANWAYRLSMGLT